MAVGFDLHDYATGERIRPAHRYEALASAEAAEGDGGAGVILIAAGDVLVDESEWVASLPTTRRCYVVGDPDVIRAAAETPDA